MSACSLKKEREITIRKLRWQKFCFPISERNRLTLLLHKLKVSYMTEKAVVRFEQGPNYFLTYSLRSRWQQIIIQNTVFKVFFTSGGTSSHKQPPSISDHQSKIPDTFSQNLIHVFGTSQKCPSGLCSSRARWPLAPKFCPRATSKSQSFHTNHMPGTLDFTVSEHWAPFNFP